MSDSTLQPQSAKPEEKVQRNPVERLIVWGGIGLLVIVVFTEGTARFGYSMTLSRLQERIQEDEGPDAKPLSVEESSTLIVGFPSKTSADGMITYRFKGLLKEFGAIHLPYDDENTILGLVTDAPPEVDLAPASGEDTDAEAESGMAGMSADAAGDQSGNVGEGGGRRNFDPMQFDADGDGKISLEEAPERMKESFAELDANGDGFADAEEFAARRALRQRQRAEQGASAELSNEPQTSDADATEAPEKGATPETPSQPE